jgi:hypothetical protein
VAVAAFGLCAALELFQLTGIPARLAGAVPAVALVLGTGFSPLDFAAYAVGAASGLALHPLLWRRPGENRGATLSRR